MFLGKKEWQGDPKCLFFGQYEIAQHLFVNCSYVRQIWEWIVLHNNFSFNCQSLNDLWFLDCYIPLKD